MNDLLIETGLEKKSNASHAQCNVLARDNYGTPHGYVHGLFIYHAMGQFVDLRMWCPMGDIMPWDAPWDTPWEKFISMVTRRTSHGNAMRCAFP